MAWSQKRIHNIVVTAIQKLQSEDSELLDPAYNINERTITHLLAVYLKESFPEFHVDCEYNRQHGDGADEYIAKNVDLPRRDGGFEDLEAKTVFPDIIVHIRQTQRNLLALEIKMGWKTGNINFDRTKAEAYKKALGYRYAAYLVIGPNEHYQINWV